MALYLARRGHDVALHYATSAAEAEAVAAEIRAMAARPRRCRPTCWTKPLVESLVPRAVAALGR